jgi:hypothetical protein
MKQQHRFDYVNPIRWRGGRWEMGYDCPISGDPQFDWLWPTLKQWLADRLIGHAPVCVCCGNKIVNRDRPPQQFLLVEIDAVAERAPKQAWLTDICDYCSSRDDDELTKLALRRVFGKARMPRRVDGRMLGIRWRGGVYVFDDDGHGSPPMARQKADHGSGSSDKAEHEVQKKEDER